MIIFNPSTENTRFDYVTMQSEWIAFLKDGGCGMQGVIELDLLTALVSHHARLFLGRMHGEGIQWDDLNGHFACSERRLMLECIDGDFPLTREELDLIWADTFDVVHMHFDVIEGSVREARGWNAT